MQIPYTLSLCTVTSEVPIVVLFIIVDLPKIFHSCCVFLIVLYFRTEFHAIRYSGLLMSPVHWFITYCYETETKRKFRKASMFLFNVLQTNFHHTRLITTGRFSGPDVSDANFIPD